MLPTGLPTGLPTSLPSGLIAALSGLSLVAPAMAGGPCPPGVGQTLTLETHSDYAHSGRSVGVSAGLLVVGAHDDDRGGIGNGSVAVYRLGPDDWRLDQQLLPPNPSVGGWFGYSVSTDSGRVLVGAPFTVVSGQAVGTAHVFRYEPGAGWIEEAELLAPTRSNDDRFGHSVALSGGIAAVGVPRDDRPGATNSGSVMMFERTDAGWIHTQTIQPPTTATAEAGWSVAFDGRTLVVGAPHDDTGAPNAGRAFVYTSNDGIWTLAADLPGPQGEPNAVFGWSVGVSGDRALVGAPDLPVAGSNARGGVFAFQQSAGVWQSTGPLPRLNPDPDDRFGTGVAVRGERAVVGDAGSDQAWLFGAQGPGWSDPVGLLPADEPLRFFGVSAAISDTYAVIGADRLAGAAYAMGLPCACRADLNADGVLNFFDFAAYLGAYGTGEHSADLALPYGVLNFFDLAVYIGLYSAGCP